MLQKSNRQLTTTIMANFAETKALTFDLFGTILDLGGSLTPFIDESLKARNADVSADEFWAQWRYRQRIEQYQDTIVMLGHSGYLETVRRAVHYVLRANGIDATPDTVEEFMRGWQSLPPFQRCCLPSRRCNLGISWWCCPMGIPRFWNTSSRNGLDGSSTL